MNPQPEEDIQNLDFETAFNALQETVSLLETEELSLEKALESYARGQALAKRCAALLEKAELQVRQLSMDTSQTLEEEV
jgi:exodeoxyribonuclease VII small subunit